MARGKNAKPGDTRVSANGYHYTRTQTEWRLTHHLLAEEALGRPLKSNERVYFKDKDRTNLSPDNVKVQEVVSGKEQRVRYLKAKIKEYQEELKELQYD